MEEKIYFTPEKHNNKKPNKRDHQIYKKIIRYIILIIFTCVIIAVVVLLLHGKTTVSGAYPENVKNTALSCKSNKNVPPKMGLSPSSTSHEVDIEAIFSGTEKLKKLSLVFRQDFASEDDAYMAETISHAGFNKSLAGANYSSDKFTNKFSRYDTKLIISLFANENEIDQISAPFFMIALPNNNETLPKTIDDLRSNFEAQGFECVIANNN